MAFQVLFGVIGIGITVLVFVILGNPSAGGAYQTSLLPPFWRFLSNGLPNGAGTDAVRRIVYLGSNGITGHVVVIAIYALVGALVAIIGSHLLHRREVGAKAPTPEPVTAALSVKVPPLASIVPVLITALVIVPLPLFVASIRPALVIATVPVPMVRATLLSASTTPPD